ncbi:hypothetical protein ACWCP6_28560 [Streptomyces sp. NPDC002004]
MSFHLEAQLLGAGLNFLVSQGLVSTVRKTVGYGTLAVPATRASSGLKR